MMLGIIPWYDEVTIVEAGRMFLSGFDGASILLHPDGGGLYAPICYLGPCIQELAFRIFGACGPRMMGYVGCALLWQATRAWLRKTTDFPHVWSELLALGFAFHPLIFQTTVMGRADALALGCMFSALAVLGPAGTIRSWMRITAAAILSVSSLYIWPSAFMLLAVYPAFAFDWEHKGDAIRFAAVSAAFAGLFFLPVLPVLSIAVDSMSHSFGTHAKGSFSIMSIVENFARETARDGLFMLLAGIGFGLWFRKLKYMAILSFLFAMALCLKTGLYTFRFVYLLPIMFLMVIEALCTMYLKYRRCAFCAIGLTGVYSLLVGPIAHCIAPAPELPKGTAQVLERIVGRGPVNVFAPDYVAYYIGRELGWRQFGPGYPGFVMNETFRETVVNKCEWMVLRDWNRYEMMQRCYSPYGLICQYLLDSAKNEESVPNEDKSLAARLGSRFAFPWRPEMELRGFYEVGRCGCLHVFKRGTLVPISE